MKMSDTMRKCLCKRKKRNWIWSPLLDAELVLVTRVFQNPAYGWDDGNLRDPCDLSASHSIRHKLLS